jgi:pimeloyl-[acyl-carrier protein] methyl ester esterase
LILLQGLSRESAHWGPFVPALAAANPDATVVTLDLPGTGSRLNEVAPLTMRETVDRVREEAASRVPTGASRWLFGLSLGGIVAMHWAASYPGELAGLVVASAPSSFVSSFKRLRPKFYVVLALNMFLPGDALRRQTRVARLALNRTELQEDTVRAWAEIERKRPVSQATVRAQFKAASDCRAPEAIGVRKLFLVGQKDRMIHPDCTRSLAKRYAGRLVEHPEAGHDLTTDDAGWVAGEVARFRGEVEGARST